MKPVQSFQFYFNAKTENINKIQMVIQTRGQSLPYALSFAGSDIVTLKPDDYLTGR